MLHLPRKPGGDSSSAPVSRSLPNRVLKGQVGGQDNAGSFVGPADDLEEQFGSRLGKGYVSKLIQDQEMLLFQAFQETFELTVLSGFK